jgi:hypothetical protein
MKSPLTINSYQTAKEFIRRGRAHTIRRVPGIRSTAVQILATGEIAVKYHGTVVVLYCQDGSIVLNSGGFRTSTTKARINSFANVFVFQRKFVWYLEPGKIFVDGMRIGVIRQQMIPFGA